MEALFKSIAEQWFLCEPAFFSLYCTHQLEENLAMSCAVRSGQHRIEYNPRLLRGKSQGEIEQLMRIELIRIFLKHPYERQPEGVSKMALSLGSDCVIQDSYGGNGEALPLMSPEQFHLEKGKHFEWYARRIDEMIEPDMLPASGAEEGAEGSQSSPDGATPSSSGETGESADGGDGDPMAQAAARADLWQEDEMAQQSINELIKTLNSWGSIPGNVVQQIIASTQARIDYRLIWQGFRGHILSSKRRLTRMRPNRRTGFDQMGSQRKFDTRLLVAVDVSGSISDRTLTHFYSVVNRFFKYGIDEIDCVQFDCVLGEVQSLRKASRRVQICGRGGTSFQPIFDYLLEHNIYDGVVILTDGGAPHPVVDSQVTAKVLWVCEDEQSYNQCKDWMQLFGRCCYMVL